ncbi:MAG: NirD/YgiW/YdeI family stress tolerance protein [Desulfobulbaceae bacterium]|nr:NirD/YgiW/YdeI family stress tolerance protein [Desulfobulbaceae bacterium]
MIKQKTFSAILSASLIMLALTIALGDNYKIQSIAEASVMQEGTWVALQGNITKKIRDDYFLLVDESGEIELKIRGDQWGQYSYDTTRKSEVYGKIILENGVAKLEAKKIIYTK